MGKRTDYAALRAGFGLARGLSDEFIQACERINPPIEAIHRLVTPNGQKTMDEIVRRAVADWQAEQPASANQTSHKALSGSATADRPQPPTFVESKGGHAYRDAPTNGNKLPADHYSVRVTYAPMPSFADLKKEFGEDNVSVIFDGREWKLDSSCVGMDRTPGEKIFLVKDFGRGWESEEAIAWGRDERTSVAPNGYRPATHEEEYEFQKAHPEIFNLVALGSFALDGDIRCVAYLWSDGYRRCLDCGKFDGEWVASYRCLFVSK